MNRFWSNLFDGQLSDGGPIRGLLAAVSALRPTPAEGAAAAAGVQIAPQAILGPSLLALAPLPTTGVDFVQASAGLTVELGRFGFVPVTDGLLPDALSAPLLVEIVPAGQPGPVASPDDGPAEILSPLGALSGSATAVALFSTTASLDAVVGVSAKSAVAAASGRYQVVFSEDLTPTLVIDTATREILTGGATDPELGIGDDDTLALSGDFSAGANLPAGLQGLDTLVLGPDDDYVLTANEDNVSIGDTLTINAMPLGPGQHVEFDGGAESDGRFVFFGGAGNDVFSGGAGNDRIHGLLGADSLAGGGGADTFAYTGAAESSGAAYDTLADFDPGVDRIDLLGGVSGFAATIEGGALAADTFDADLAAALGAGQLGAGQAVLFTPDAGSLSGTLFLVVDANGQAGYQAGEDYVFALPNTDLADLTGNTGIFV